MPRPELEYDVYNTPRLGPVQFGDFVAAEGSERERILQNAKFFKRTHRVRAWYAREEITHFLAAPRRNIGALDAALEEVEEEIGDSTLSDEKRQDSAASADCIKRFKEHFDEQAFRAKDLIALDEVQYPVKVGDMAIEVNLACLVKSVSRQGVNRVGAIYLNTQAGKGLGSRDETVTRRTKAGETVALLVLKKIIDEFANIGQPFSEDIIHYYIRQSHIWRAPKSFDLRLRNLDAEARTISRLWSAIPAPEDFDPKKAKMHD